MSYKERLIEHRKRFKKEIEKNLRLADCCESCVHYENTPYEASGDCRKYDFLVDSTDICDDFEKTKKEDTRIFSKDTLKKIESLGEKK